MKLARNLLLTLLRRLTIGKETSWAADTVDLAREVGVCRTDPREPSDCLAHGMV